MTSTKIELLAPAKDLATARQAILHGADAVYIGAEHFGARAGAANSIEDIRTLCDEAHQFGVKVDVTLNTILYDQELEAARKLVWQLYEAGVDALIVQDMALLKMDLPPIALHASTQMDNRSPEKVRWLHELGFEQVVLARELGLKDIENIHRQVPDVALEVFVHGSICVCYNGQCYASQHLFRRSANRGECAQVCRMPFDLVDAEGRILEKQRYLLSMRDMNRSNELEQLLDAGARSLKIEGRLKDIAYVKNVVAHYRLLLDQIMARRPEYERSSHGETTFLPADQPFTPRLEAAFNRGSTNYFLHGRTPDLANLITPKSMGERVGVVKEIRRDCIVVAGSASFRNGDGLCFLNEQQRLEGFRINRAEGNHLFVRQLPRTLRRGMKLWRNQSMQFEAQMARPTATRQLAVQFTLSETSTGFSLTALVEEGRRAQRNYDLDKELSRSSQDDNIRKQLSRLGNTIFRMDECTLQLSQNWFIPDSTLARWRKDVVADLLAMGCQKPKKGRRRETATACLPSRLDYTANVANHLARDFYLEQGVQQVDMAFEVNSISKTDTPKRLMQCRYCILAQLGHCKRKNPLRGVASPLSLRLADGRRLRLEFDCNNCQMNVYNS